MSKSRLAILLGLTGLAGLSLIGAGLLVVSNAGLQRPWTVVTVLGGAGVLLVAVAAGSFVALQIVALRDQARLGRGLRDQTRHLGEVAHAHRDALDRIDAVVRRGELAQVPKQLARLERGLADITAGLRDRSVQREDVDQAARKFDTRMVELVTALEGLASEQAASSRAASTAILERILEAHDRIEIAERTLLAAQNADYRQVEGLFSIFSTLRPELPLPPFRGWAVSPDFAARVVELVRSRRPEFVVEVGSGVSTLLIARTLMLNGTGRLVSLEHDEAYAQATRALLESHGVAESTKVVHAPLTSVELSGARWQWYDIEAVELEGPVDLLLVDGPPEGTGELARYPALPILGPRISPGGVVLLDDANRVDEKRIVERWLEEFDDFVLTDLPHEKGTAELRRRP